MKHIYIFLVALFISGLGFGQSVFINEIHYDDDGADIGEGIEIAGPAGTNLINYTLTPYNGNGGGSYSVTTLSGTIPNEGGTGFGTIFFPISGLQNGAPDGIALDDGVSLIQFLSYEGSFTASNGIASGSTSVDIGVSESGNVEGESLQLTGTGTVYSDFSWNPSNTSSYNAINSGQTFIINTGPEITNIAQTPTIVTSTDAVAVSADVVDAAGISSVSLNWGITSGSLGNNIAMSLSAFDTYVTNTDIPAQIEGTTVYYEIVATNTTMDVTTSPEQSYSVQGPPPSNNTCANATVLMVDDCASPTYTNVNGTNSGTSPAPGCANYAGADVWFAVVVPSSGNLNIETTAGGITDGGMALYSGTCASLSLITCDDDTNGLMPAINVTGLVPSSTVYILFWEFGGDTEGDFGICVTEPVCSVSSLGLANIACNDNGTPSDSSDDITSFELNPTGDTLGATYSVDMDGFTSISTTIGGPFTSDIVSGISYGAATTFYLEPGSAGIGGNLDALVIDSADANCFDIATITDPGSCSDSCVGSTTTFPYDGVSGATNLEHSSSNNPGSSGEDCGDNYRIYYTTAPSTDGSGNYLRSNASDGLIESSDWGGEANFETFAIDVATVNAVIVETFGNTTGSGFNAGSEAFQWWYTLDGGTQIDLGTAFSQPYTGTLGIAPTNIDVTGINEIIVGFTFNMNGGSDGFEAVDVTVTSALACTIDDVGLSNIACNDNGTALNALDDITSFELNPSGNNLGASYSVDMDGFANISTNISGPFTSTVVSGIAYGAATTFYLEPGSAGIGGDLDALVIDSGDANCFGIAIITDPASCSAVVTGPTIIAIQDFDGTLPEWTYTTTPEENSAACVSNGDVWNVVSSLGNIDVPNSTGDFFGGQDLNGATGCGTSGTGTIDFNPISVAGFSNMVLSFDYEVDGFNAASDEISYIISLDGIPETEEFLCDFCDQQNVRGTISFNVPNGTNSVSLQIRAIFDGGSDYFGVDNFKIEGDYSGLVYSNNAWNPSAPTAATGGSDVLILDGTYTVDADVAVNDMTVSPSANVIVDSGITLSTNSLTLESTSSSFSSLINNGSISGTVNYERFVNQIGQSGVPGGNDLISAPLGAGGVGPFALIFQTFLGFGSPANSSLIASLGNIYAFAPFNIASAGFENISFDTNFPPPPANQPIIEAGKGYRVATSNGANLTFTGAPLSGNASIAISTAASQWNLIGNPYPSYISSALFLSTNTSLLDETILDPEATAIYGYNSGNYVGDTGGNTALYTIINANTNSGLNIAPGQGFFVASNATGGAIQFTPAMQTTTGMDDFIVGRSSSPNYKLILELQSAQISSTSFFFNQNSTRGLDPGYDAAVFGENVDSTPLFSHLVEDNTGRAMAMQSLGESDFSDVLIPLGVNANQGTQLHFAIAESSLPSTTEVYLEDQVANTSTLLNTSDYVLTPNSNLSGTGRFFLRFGANALSTADEVLDAINIFTEQSSRSVVFTGVLAEATTAKLFDLQGRLVVHRPLKTNTTSQRIALNNLSSGIYVVQLESANQTKTQKVILK